MHSDIKGLVWVESPSDKKHEELRDLLVSKVKELFPEASPEEQARYLWRFVLDSWAQGRGVMP